jgi:outer membrane lipoprotein
MRKVLLSALVVVLLVSCTPVIRKDLMETGTRNFSLQDLLANPEQYSGQLFILGGIVVATRLTENGSLIEALYVPVDSLGGLKEIHGGTRRFLALCSREMGILDPMIYKKDREVTIAGRFEGNRTGKVDEMDYVYPFFTIEQVHLWQERPAVVQPIYPMGPYPYWGRPYWGYPYPGYPWWW